MIGRVVTMAAGLTGAAGMSQFPEYSQQYMQRLGGAVDALEQVVADFDASAQSSGYTREEALNQLQGTEFLDKRRADITRTIARSKKLSADLNTLQGAGPFTRAYYAARFTDNDLASAALENYKPAMPITFDGIVFAITGFLAGSITLAGVMWLIRRPFQRKNTISPS